MDQLFQELRIGARSIARSPGLTGVAVLALALGIGLTTTMFSIVNGVVLQGLPFEESEKLLHIEANQLADDLESMEIPLHDYLEYKDQQTTFEDLGAFYEGTIYVTDDVGPLRYDGAFMTDNTFSLLRARPEIGRLFLPGEGQKSAELVLVLGYRTWQDRYHGSTDVLGEAVRVNGEMGTIVGVMPDGFRFSVESDVWVPLRMDPLELKRGEGATLEVFGRLADGRTPEEASVEMAGIAQRLEAEYPETNEGVGSVVKPYISEFIGEEAIALLFVMLGAVFGVLLIACANVANLLLARASLRIKEVAIRSALGASRARVIGQQLAQSVVLAAVGGAIGLGLGALGAKMFNDVLLVRAPGVPFWFDIGLNTRVALFVLAVSGIASILAGILPAIQSSRADVNAVLKDESRGSSGLRIGWMSRTLVIGEIAVSCALLVSSGLMVKSVVQLNTFELEYLTDEVFTSRLGLFETDYPDAQSRRRFWEDLRHRIEARPGVEAVSISSGLPVWGGGQQRFAVDGVAYAEERDHPRAGRFIVSPGYFETFGVKLAGGRAFDEADIAGSQPVAIVSQSFVDKFIEGPLGKSFRADATADDEEPWRTIVGVAPDLSQLGNFEATLEIWYEPIEQSDLRFASISARTAGAPMSLTSLVREEVAALDPNLPIYWVFTMAQQVERQTWFYSVFGTLFMIFGGVALFLASIGLYAVIAFSVTRRTQEIGVRMAIGASASHVLKMILRQGVVQLGVGVGLGLAIALALSKTMNVMLSNVDAWDPSVFVAIVLVLSLTGLVATVIPALRATRVDPADALHYE